MAVTRHQIIPVMLNLRQEVGSEPRGVNTDHLTAAFSRTSSPTSALGQKLTSSSEIPVIAKPLFIGLAELKLVAGMNADDLRRGLKIAIEAM